MKKPLCALGLGAALCLLAAAAPASAYVGLKANLFLPNSDSEGLKDWDAGVGLDGIVGYEMLPFAVEVSAGLYRTTYDKNKNSSSLVVLPLTVTAKGILDAGEIRLYGGGGLGLYIANLTIDPKNGEEDNAGSAALGFHLLAGGDADLGGVTLFGEGRLIMSETSFDFDEYGETSDIKIGGIMLSAGARF